MFLPLHRINRRGWMLLALLTLAALLLLVPAHSVYAAANPVGTGQPSQSCEDIGVRPGSAMHAPGSAFNPDGTSGMVYAGSQAVNQKNTHSVSQYDVACFQVAQH